ncbi:MAG: tetraacyldisaccharide 4'-kinase [Rikenellaceae bacterium]|nr:tetraacyldisaccharide 4'-kinase [Rikenellaceae bacterium]
MLRKFFTAPLSWLYGLTIAIRHKLFDWGILKVEEFDIPVVCVGNLAVGGTGKTPHAEYIINVLKNHYNVALLSRGYKRRTRGFILADTTTSYLKIGDEPRQIKMKFPDVPVAVCENRVKGIKELRKLHPEIDLIVLDDAFQHRYVDAWVNVLLMDYNNPAYRDKFLPLGGLRDSVKQISRAHLIIMTKCPDYLKPIDIRVAINNLDLYPYQTPYFSKFRQGEPIPVFPEHNSPIPGHGANVVVMSGIANNDNFFDSLKNRYKILSKIGYADHHSYKVRDIHKLKKILSSLPQDTAVLVTEKDAVKLTSRKKIPLEVQRRLFFVPVEVAFLDGGEIGFKRQLEQYVKTNHKYRILHPE